MLLILEPAGSMERRQWVLQFLWSSQGSHVVLQRSPKLHVACLQTNKQKAEVAKEAKAVSEGQRPAKPKKGMSKAEREAEKHRKKTAARPAGKGRNALMEVCPCLCVATVRFGEPQPNLHMKSFLWRVQSAVLLHAGCSWV
jgi:hypothetical protein